MSVKSTNLHPDVLHAGYPKDEHEDGSMKDVTVAGQREDVDDDTLEHAQTGNGRQILEDATQISVQLHTRVDETIDEDNDQSSDDGDDEHEPVGGLEIEDVDADVELLGLAVDVDGGVGGMHEDRQKPFAGGNRRTRSTRENHRS